MTAADLFTPATSGHWQRLLSGEGGDVLDLQVGEVGELVAVTRLGLFRSTDAGDAWTRIETPPLIETLHRARDWWLGSDIGLFRAEYLDGPWQAMVSGVAVTGVSAGNRDELVLIATTDEGVLRSEDGGAAWDDANAGLPGDGIVSIHRSPSFQQDQTIFAATESGLFRSRNGGRAWRQVALDAGEIQCFAVADNRLLVGTADAGVWASADAGRTWSQWLATEGIIGFGRPLTANPIVLCDSGLVRVDANGYPARRAPLPPEALCAIETGNRLLAGTIGHGVLRLNPASGRWDEASHGLEASARDRVRTLGVSRLVTTSASGEIVHSADSGATWQELPGSPLATVIDFDARLDANGGLAVVACDDRDTYVFREHWQKLDADSPLAVAWHGNDVSLLNKGGTYRCKELRASLFPWRPRLTGARLFPLPERREVLWSVLYTANEGVIVVRSPDGGRQWEPMLQVNTAGAVSLAVAIDPAGNEVALFAEGARIYSVLESPAPRWTGDEALAISAIAVGPDDRILLATNRGLLACSRHFSTVDLIKQSPAPLLDVATDGAGNVIAIERGGSVWRCALA
jgi:photosystem II stability/assembly factor-like uncharacterized protein